MIRTGVGHDTEGIRTGVGHDTEGILLNLFSVCQEIVVSLHFLLAGLQMSVERDSTLNINTFMSLGDGPQGCGKVIENNKNK